MRPVQNLFEASNFPDLLVGLSSPDDAAVWKLDSARALVVTTEWNEFKQLDMAAIKESMRRPVLIDGRNLYEPERMKELGFTYRGVGRGYNGF